MVSRGNRSTGLERAVRYLHLSLGFCFLCAKLTPKEASYSQMRNSDHSKMSKVIIFHFSQRLHKWPLHEGHQRNRGRRCRCSASPVRHNSATFHFVGHFCVFYSLRFLEQKSCKSIVRFVRVRGRTGDANDLPLFPPQFPYLGFSSRTSLDHAISSSLT